MTEGPQAAESLSGDPDNRRVSVHLRMDSAVSEIQGGQQFLKEPLNIAAIRPSLTCSASIGSRGEAVGPGAHPRPAGAL